MFAFNYQYDDGHGPVVVLLHGFMGCLKNWADLRQQLRPQWRTMAIDMPGHGGTPIANFGAPDAFERLPAALEDLLDGLSLDSVHLLGYSMGGRLALALALRAPERFASLVLEGVSPGLETDEDCVVRQGDERAWAEALVTDRNRFLDEWQAQPLFDRQRERNPEGYAAALRLRLKSDPAEWAGALQGYGLGRQPNLWPQLAHLNLPVLLITGDEDTRFTLGAQRMVSVLPNASHKVVAQAAHTPHLEQPVAFNRIVAEFLETNSH